MLNAAPYNPAIRDALRGVAAEGTASELFSTSFADAAFFLAAPITVLGLGALLTSVEGGHLF